jgi:carbon monoxide dehydrogenase subunit G
MRDENVPRTAGGAVSRHSSPVTRHCYYGGPGTFSSSVHIVIEISERIEVAAAPGTVWDVLSDPRAVVDCVPGAELGEQQEDGSYDATVTVKFGPAKVTFRTKVALELDEAAMSGRVSSRGRDNQGGTRVKTTMTFKVVAGAAPGTAAVPVDAQVEISGKLASLVESGANLVVKHMTKEFSERLAARVAGVKAQ